LDLAGDQSPTTDGVLILMDIADWRRKIDEIDRKLVEFLGQRAQAVHAIGKLKHSAGMPVYEPDREKKVFENAAQANSGPLADRDLLRIFERIVDVMRQSEMAQVAASPATAPDGLGDTELGPEVND
jgi:chorismate mutase